MEDAAPARADAVKYGSTQGRWVLVVTVLGSGIAFLDATVVNIGLPAIGSDLDASISGLQWVLNGYLLTLAALILLGGSLGDRLGRRRMFMLGVTWFTIASAICAASPNITFLIVARILQGVGGALLTPASLAIIEATYRKEDRARAIGAWSALTGVSTAIGPLVGGYLISAVSWRAIFFLNLPLGVFVVLAGRRHVPETRDPNATGSLDFRGSFLAALGLAGVTFALIEAPTDAGAALVATAGAIGVIAMLVFVRTEQHEASPMLPLDIFRSRQFTAANLVTFVVYGALGGVFFLFVVFLQTSLGYSPTAAGAASLPITALMLTLSARSGALASRIGPRRQLAAGPLIIAAAMVMMATIDRGDSYLGAVFPAMVVFGLGLACTVAPITATAMASATSRHSGIASGVNNAVSRTAQLMAVAALPLAAGISGTDYADPAGLVSGFHKGMLLTAAFAAVGGVLAWFLISDDVLASDDEAEVEEPRSHCAVAGTPLHEPTDREPVHAGASGG